MSTNLVAQWHAGSVAGALLELLEALTSFEFTNFWGLRSTCQARGEGEPETVKAKKGTKWILTLPMVKACKISDQTFASQEFAKNSSAMTSIQRQASHRKDNRVKLDSCGGVRGLGVGCRK